MTKNYLSHLARQSEIKGGSASRVGACPQTAAMRLNTLNLCRSDFSILKVSDIVATFCIAAIPATVFLQGQSNGHMQHAENMRSEESVR
jgi:hypothetical protein